MRSLRLLTPRRFSKNTSVRFRLSFEADICSSSSRVSISTSTSGMSRFTTLMYAFVETVAQSKGSEPTWLLCCARKQESAACSPKQIQENEPCEPVEAQGCRSQLMYVQRRWTGQGKSREEAIFALLPGLHYIQNVERSCSQEVRQ